MPETERRTPADLIREWREKAQGLRAAADAPSSGGVVISQPDVVEEWHALEQLYDDCADDLEAALQQAEPPTGETPPAAFIADAVGVLVTWRNRLRADQAMRYTTSDDEKALTAALTVAIDTLARGETPPAGEGALIVESHVHRSRDLYDRLFRRA